MGSSRAFQGVRGTFQRGLSGFRGRRFPKRYMGYKSVPKGFRGVQTDFNGFREVSGAFQRGLMLVSVVFKGVLGVFHGVVVKGSFRSVAEDFKVFQLRSR